MFEFKSAVPRLRNIVLSFGIGLLVGGILLATFVVKKSVVYTDAGIVETTLQPWQVSEATGAFILQKGWGFERDENPSPYKTLRIANDFNGDRVVLECAQERTRSGGVTVYITVNGDSGQNVLANELSQYFQDRFGNYTWRL